MSQETIEEMFARLARSIDAYHSRIAASLREAVDDYTKDPSMPLLVARVLATADVIEGSALEQFSVKAPLSVVPEDAA